MRSALARQAERTATSVRRGAKAPPHVRLGDALVAAGLMTPDQVRRVLRARLLMAPSGEAASFGEIAVARRYITRARLEEAVSRQVAAVLEGREAPHLRDMLLEMGAFDERSAEAITAWQARADSVPMSELARERSAAPAARWSPSPARYLPSGARAAIADNCIWLALALAAALSVAMILLRDWLFG